MKKLRAGIDIGNAKTELVYEKNGQLQFVRQPSVTAMIMSRNDESDLPIEQLMNNLYDNLIVSISSKAISSAIEFKVGKKAMLHNGIKNTMPIGFGNLKEGKSNQDLPLMTSLTLIAATALKDYYEMNNKLPEDLTIEAELATAIPSSEFKNSSAKNLESRFTSKPHDVSLFIGDHVVRVKVIVTACKVTEEGRTSMLAFLKSSDDILKEFNEIYKSNLKPKDFKHAKSLHVDIGDGTTEMVVIDGATPVQGQSDGFSIGVGHASELAIKDYKEEYAFSPNSPRQQFQDLLKKDGEKANKARELMFRATEIQAVTLLEEIRLAYQNMAQSDVDYIFVHGGGSVSFKQHLQDRLMAFAEENAFKVVWIPEKYATTMNSKGTFYLAELMAKQKIKS